MENKDTRKEFFELLNSQQSPQQVRGGVTVIGKDDPAPPQMGSTDEGKREKRK